MPIIFITNLARYAVKGYEVEALDFMVKPVSYSRFSMKMDKALRVIGRSQGVQVAVPTEQGMRILSSRDITYTEVFDHDLLYHTESASYRMRGSLSRQETELAGHNFQRISVSHLVNLAFVSGFTGTSLFLSSGEELTVSRSRKKETMSAIAQYLGWSV